MDIELNLNKYNLNYLKCIHIQVFQSKMAILSKK